LKEAEMVHRVVLGILIFILTALTSCGPRNGGPIAIGVRTANDHSPFYIADKFGYYADEGLEAEVQLVPSNTEIIEAIQRGDLQVGAAPVTTAIAAIARSSFTTLPSGPITLAVWCSPARISCPSARRH